jgi:hypothetical protein
MTSRSGSTISPRTSLREPPPWTPHCACPGARSARTVPAALDQTPCRIHGAPTSLRLARPAGSRRTAGAQDRRERLSPIGVLVEEPATRAQAVGHLPDRLFLASLQMEQHQSRADEIERTRPEHVEWVLEDVVLDYLEIRELDRLAAAGREAAEDERLDLSSRSTIRSRAGDAHWFSLAGDVSRSEQGVARWRCGWPSRSCDRPRRRGRRRHPLPLLRLCHARERYLRDGPAQPGSLCRGDDGFGRSEEPQPSRHQNALRPSWDPSRRLEPARWPAVMC